MTGTREEGVVRTRGARALIYLATVLSLRHHIDPLNLPGLTMSAGR